MSDDAIAKGSTGSTVKYPEKVVLVSDADLIEKVLTEHTTYSSEEQLSRCKKSMGEIYVAQDPGDDYYKESSETNTQLYLESAETSFKAAYKISTLVLNQLKITAQTIASMKNVDPADAYMKIELRRQFIRPVLGLLCRYWFGIPDQTHIELGDWDSDHINGRQPRCPGDFMAPSRYGFYPRPKPAIRKYGKDHGQALAKSGLDFVKANRGPNPPGTISRHLFGSINDDDLLAKNIIGIMVGALPPMDANIRGILFDWITNDHLWRTQGVVNHSIEQHGLDFAKVSEVLAEPVTRSMSKRPAPDLIYRTATKDDTLVTGDKPVHIKKDDTVVLCLAAATQHKLHTGQTPNVDLVFGGRRQGAKQPPDKPQHACPGYKMAMGATYGMLTALLTAGTIRALPASLIIEIGNWKPVGDPKIDLHELRSEELEALIDQG